MRRWISRQARRDYEPEHARQEMRAAGVGDSLIGAPLSAPPNFLIGPMTPHRPPNMDVPPTDDCDMNDSADTLEEDEGDNESHNGLPNELPSMRRQREQRIRRNQQIGFGAFGEDIWAQMDQVNLAYEFRHRVNTCKTVPRCVRGRCVFASSSVVSHMETVISNDPYPQQSIHQMLETNLADVAQAAKI